ncbi:MAG: site-2 protease family protein [Clostridia bacterium]|nr:site-2 protease family protein [Clostridia bacterium]
MSLFNLLSVADFFKSLWGVLLAIIVLLVMVVVHEFGHYVAGKILHFRINEFSVGFGPAILKKRSKKTGELFSLRVIPLGGYCAFEGEDGLEEETEPQVLPTEEPFAELQPPVEEAPKKEEEYPEPKGARFTEQAPWKRIIVLVSGALMNYLLALVLLLIMTATYGVPMCMAMPSDFKNDGTQIVPSASWETPTLSARDIFKELNGVEISMHTDCIEALEGKKAGETVNAVVLRKTDSGWKEKAVTLTLQADGNFADMADIEGLHRVLGLKVYTTTLKGDFGQTVGGAFAYSGEMATAVLKTLGQLLTGQLGVEAVGGPVTTITETAKAASASAFSLLYIASFIGVNLAVFNLLPVPALDGSKVVFCIIEWIRKKPINRKVEAILHFVGVIVIFGFAILIDLLKLF